MAQKNAKVTAVTPNGTWESKYGLMYKFEVTFDNGDAGQMNGKQPECKFKVGEQVAYELSSREYNGNTYYTIKPVTDYQPGGGGGFKKDPATEKRIVRMNVLQRAVDLVLHERIEMRNLLATAEKLEKWVHDTDSKAVNQVEVDKPQAAQQPAVEQEEDLPF